MFKSLIKITLASTLALSAANCANLPAEHPINVACGGKKAPLCLFIALAVGGVVGALAGPSAAAPIIVASDHRLKTNVTYYKTTENGIKLYGYRYKGDDRVFIGVMAQDLLKDKRYASAVTKGQDGYYRVNYGKLGLKLKSGGMMRDAGERAIARMR